MSTPTGSHSCWLWQRLAETFPHGGYRLCPNETLPMDQAIRKPDPIPEVGG
jgi:hypothetical protein